MDQEHEYTEYKQPLTSTLCKCQKMLRETTGAEDRHNNSTCVRLICQPEMQYSIQVINVPCNIMTEEAILMGLKEARIRLELTHHTEMHTGKQVSHAANNASQ